MKLNKQVFMGSLKQIALGRVAVEAGTVAVLIGAVGASLGWLLLPLFLTPVTTSQVTLIIPMECAMSHRRENLQLLCVMEKMSVLLSASRVPRGARGGRGYPSESPGNHPKTACFWDLNFSVI